MTTKFLPALTLALLAGCAAPPPPPPPGSAASKVVALGTMDHIQVGEMRVARENGFLTVKVAVQNTSHNNQPLFYRFTWLGNDGFPVGEEEAWKPATLYGEQSTFLQAIAPIPRASDFRLEVQSPNNSVNLFR